ncbi:tyrosine--tRNA ligase [Patescibacteria group bacterium]|nr:tyrosine--tRNA ligase [Patescibacteria group bacterium]
MKSLKHESIKTNQIIIDKKKIEEFLSRGIENIYPSREFLLKLLQSGKKLKVYLGIDPTGPTLHIGHIVNLKNLQKFQDLGHQVIMLIGDFTARIGDPSDKLATRKPLTHQQVLENAKLYQEQASKILKFDGDNPAEIIFNSKWLDDLMFKDIIELASNFTVQQLLERDMFQERIKNGKPISLHEFLYPLMQAYDSVFMDVDGEVGGNDQTFNMLAGRDLMKAMLKKEKFVLSGKLLTDPSGTKMGKTQGNMIALSDTPQDMYGKIMAQPDELILPYYELVTDLSIKAIEKIEKKLEHGANPRDIKADLAREVVTMFYDKKDADKTAREFDKVFKDKAQPTDILEVKISGDKFKVADLLVEIGLVKSKSEARRMVEQGGVKIDGKKIDDWEKEVKVKDGMVVSVGKRRFVKITNKH